MLPFLVLAPVVVLVLLSATAYGTALVRMLVPLLGMHAGPMPPPPARSPAGLIAVIGGYASLQNWAVLMVSGGASLGLVMGYAANPGMLSETVPRLLRWLIPAHTPLLTGFGIVVALVIAATPAILTVSVSAAQGGSAEGAEAIVGPAIVRLAALGLLGAQPWFAAAIAVMGVVRDPRVSPQSVAGTVILVFGLFAVCALAPTAFVFPLASFVLLWWVFYPGHVKGKPTAAGSGNDNNGDDNDGDGGAGRSAGSASKISLSVLLKWQFVVVAVVLTFSVVMTARIAPRVGILPTPHNVPEARPTAGEGGRYSMVNATESLTGFISVVDDAELEIRVLKAGHSVLGGFYTANHDPIFGVFFLHTLPAVLRDGVDPVRSALQIGLGIGTAATSLQALGVTVDVVELDPAVLSMAETHFGYRADALGGRSVAADVRDVLGHGAAGREAYLGPRGRTGYDLVLHDVFTNGGVDLDLVAAPAVAALKAALADVESALVINFYGHTSGPLAAVTHAMYATLQSAFRNVRVFGDEHGRDHGNYVFIASDGRLAFRAATDDDFDGDAGGLGGGSLMREVFFRRYLQWEVTDAIADGGGATANPIQLPIDPTLAALQHRGGLEHYDGIKGVFPADFWLYM